MTRFSGFVDDIMDPAEIVDLINGSTEKSVVVSSNLRRAISTCLISIWDRLERDRG